MKDIREYLPYYIGQKHRYRYMDWEEGHWTPWYTLKPDQFDSLGDISIDGIQLALRKLDDMIEEEVLDLFELAYCGFVAFDPVIVYDGMGYQHGTTVIHETVRCIQIDTYTGHPSVGGCLPCALLQLDDELIWGKFSDAGNILQDDVTSRQFEQFHYLISRGFDLFGLIDAGLAIDAKTIHQ